MHGETDPTISGSGTGAGNGPAPLLQALSTSPAALGEPLLVLGNGPIPVRGATGGIVALNERGGAVLVALFSSIPPGGATDLADELDRLAQLRDAQLAGVAGEPWPANLRRRHREAFPGAGPKIRFNREQRVHVVVREPPGAEVFKQLRAELGPHLAGVHVLQDGLLRRAPVPDELRRVERERSSRRWTALGMALSLLAGAAGARLLDRRPGDGTGSGALVSAPAVVAQQVPGDATHTQWIGQRRVVRTSDGYLVAAYSGPQGLAIVTDQADQGRSWGPPEILPVTPTSFALAIDGSNRLHIAFRDRAGVGYLNVTRGPSGLIPGPVLRLDPGATSPVVDLSVDPARSVAHIVWAGGDSGRQPVWAAVSAPDGGPPSIIQTQPLAPPGKDLSVLANIVVGPGSRVTATYRRGDSVIGWYARYLDGAGPGSLSWSPEEPLPVADSLYGAASVAVDRAGNLHVVLRDNTEYGLTYIQRTAAGAWLPPETIIDAEVTEQIDFPSISLDGSSSTVFVVFQDTTSLAQGRIKAFIKSPASGWVGPDSVATGSLLPTTIEQAAGIAVVLATNPGSGTITATRLAAR